MDSTEIIPYYPDESMQIDVCMDGETVWLTQSQMSMLFERERSVITRHIKNVFTEKELDIESNVQKMHIPNSDKPVTIYSLDVVISVGYRVKSQRGTRFRQWATRILKEHLLRGYANKLIENRLEKLETYIEEIITDQNDINDDTRMQLEEINRAIAELQVAGRSADSARVEVKGFRN